MSQVHARGRARMLVWTCPGTAPPQRSTTDRAGWPSLAEPAACTSPAGPTRRPSIPFRSHSGAGGRGSPLTTAGSVLQSKSRGRVAARDDTVSIIARSRHASDGTIGGQISHSRPERQPEYDARSSPSPETSRPASIGSCWRICVGVRRSGARVRWARWGRCKWIVSDFRRPGRIRPQHPCLVTF